MTAAAIAQLNDQFRQRVTQGRAHETLGVQMLTQQQREHLYQLIHDYDQFNPDNDPHQEHDFGDVILDGEKYFWEIDYYDLQLQYHSEDPADPSKTRRVMTIMRADEY